MTITKEQLGRRITSANEHLRAAQRDGRYADIMAWRQTRDDLLDQWQNANPDSPRENA